jgi:TolB-like protein/Tfp pilus assembly protein PilF
MAPTDIQAEVVERHLQRVLASPGFVRNERMSRFLRFIVERQLSGRESELKESLIGIEVFGRKPGFDPQQDSTVRSEAARLRARLAEYYASEVRNDALVIELPKGGYVPRFRLAEGPPSPAPQTIDRPKWRSRRWPVVAVLGGLGVVFAVVGWWRWQNAGEPIQIAVLPLTNLSQDPAEDYLADGITDELIRNLSIIDGLAVRSQTSSFVFKGKAQNVRDAAKQLNVDYILEGNTFRADQQLRINVQLIRVRDDFPVWSGRYDREVADIVAIQDEVSRGIVNSLRLKLGRGRRRYETSLEAYDLYLRARALQVRGFQNDNESIGLFQEAIAKDSSFAPAYAGLGAAYVRLSRRSFKEPVRGDELARMRAAAEKAIELDPLLAEAHDALAMAYAQDAKWEQSEKSFRQAIARDPSRSTTYADFALNLLLPLGRIEEAVQQMRIASKTDPLSPEVHDALASALLSAGRPDEAASHCEQLPADTSIRSVCLARSRMGQGKFLEAIDVLEAAVNRGLPPNAQERGYLGYAYARAGRRAEAEKLAPVGSGVGIFGRALTCAGLGDKDRTLEALERLAGAGPVRLGLDLTYPEFALLRGDSRVKVLRKKAGLPE